MDYTEEAKINKEKKEEEIFDKVNEYSFYKKLEKILKEQAKEKEKKKESDEEPKNMKLKNKTITFTILGRTGNGKSTLAHSFNTECIYYPRKHYPITLYDTPGLPIDNSFTRYIFD